MTFKHRFSLLQLVATVTAAATGAVALFQCMQIARAASREARALHLLALGAAVVVFGISVVLLRRETQRRARAAVLEKILPRYRSRGRAWASSLGEPDDVESFLFNDSEWYEESAERAAPAGAEVRAATRALLVSLEDEMRRESVRERRPGRPACRRARLRVLGRSEPRRRRVPIRPLLIPS